MNFLKIVQLHRFFLKYMHLYIDLKKDNDEQNMEALFF